MKCPKCKKEIEGLELCYSNLCEFGKEIDLEFVCLECFKVVYTKKIKLPNIIMQNLHFRIQSDGTKHYICNRACGTSKDKMTKDWKKVTCKNCLAIKKKMDNMSKQVLKRLKNPIIRESMHAFHIKKGVN